MYVCMHVCFEFDMKSLLLNGFKPEIVNVLIQPLPLSTTWVIFSTQRPPKEMIACLLPPSPVARPLLGGHEKKLATETRENIEKNTSQMILH